MNNILPFQELVPYGIYHQLEVASSCLGEALFNTPAGPEKEALYLDCCKQTPETDIPVYEVKYQDGRYQRQMLCLKLGFYFGKRHTVGPEIYVRAGAVLYTDSQMSGMLYIPPEGCIPEINNGWRAVLATAGTILQITDHSMEKICGESLLLSSLQ